MTENKPRNIFERRYLGLGGAVLETPEPYASKNEVVPQTYEELLKVYRDYMHDPKAEFTEEMLVELKRLGKI